MTHTVADAGAAYSPTRAAAPASTRIAGLCVPGQHERDADHLLVHLGVALAAADAHGVVLMTHFVPVDGRRVLACSVRADLAADTLWTVLGDVTPPGGAFCIGAREHGHDELLVAAGSALAAAEFGLSGRAVVFPGSTELSGVVTVAELVETTAIEAVTVVGRHADADGAESIDTRGYVRPLVESGRLVLPTRPAVGGLLIPAEVPNPTPCCATHG